MKNTHRIWLMLAVTAIIGFALAACGNGNNTTVDPCALGHSYAEWTITTPPTILAAGVETGTCTLCSAIGTRPVDKLTSIIEMVRVEGGTFFFGRCPQENPQGGTEETVSGFYIGKYQVTQGQWVAVMESNPSYFTTPGHGNNAARLPVERVSFYDALVFSNRLSVKEGLSPAYSIDGSTNPDDWGAVPTDNNETWNAVIIIEGSNGYRLPTEHQWEFAAKGGTKSQGFIWSGSDDPNKVAWFSGKTGLSTNDRTQEVGLLTPNELGLYDMSGNVFEWCFDLWVVTGRVIRGGSWNSDDASNARSVSRIISYPNFRWDGVGFRLVRP